MSSPARWSEERPATCASTAAPDRVDVTLRIALALVAYREVAQYERGATS